MGRVPRTGREMGSGTLVTDLNPSCQLVSTMCCTCSVASEGNFGFGELSGAGFVSKDSIVGLILEEDVS